MSANRTNGRRISKPMKSVRRLSIFTPTLYDEGMSVSRSTDTNYGIRHSRPGQTENSVKFYLTEGQVLRLLCVGAQCNLFTVRSIQLTENAHDTRIPHLTVRAGAACRDRHGRYCLYRPVCDAGRVACAVTPSGHMNLPSFCQDDVDSAPPYSS